MTLTDRIGENAIARGLLYSTAVFSWGSYCKETKNAMECIQKDLIHIAYVFCLLKASMS